MKFSVGLNFTNDNFTSSIIKNKNHIYEAYFSWGDFANGRKNQLTDEAYTPWELYDKQICTLRALSKENIKLNLLFNANCYGRDSQSRAFFEKIGTTVDYINENFSLASVTTTSPLIAKFLKNNFEKIEVRASVNMEIGTTEGMDYIAKYFDSYYMKREHNRNLEQVKHLSEWCKQNGKKLFMLANSGCLNNCSVHNFHDNLVAHESEISKMDNAYNFCGICKEYLADENNFKSLIQNTNFVRPEDICKYEGYVEAVKLATRIHNRPESVLQSYVGAKYVGNILELLEPAHSIYPYVIENGDPLKLIKLDDVF